MTHNPFIQSIATPTHNCACFGMVVDRYLDHLQARGAVCHRHMVRILDSAKSSIGADTPAESVTPEAICIWLGSIWDRGSKSMADRARAYLSAAYTHAMQFDYRTRNRSLGIKENPVSRIPATTASSHVRNRVATKDELIRFYRDLRAKKQNPAAGALLLAMLTGCRVEEASHLKVNSLNFIEGSLYWEKTKTGVSHKIGLGTAALDLLTELTHGKSLEDFIFESKRKPGTPVTSDSVLKYFGRMGFENATPRDFCRRTFTSWAQVAGLNRELIDLIQNHRERSIATRHYDRFLFLPDGIAVTSKGLRQWESWLSGLSMLNNDSRPKFD